MDQTSLYLHYIIYILFLDFSFFKLLIAWLLPVVQVIRKKFLKSSLFTFRSKALHLLSDSDKSDRLLLFIERLTPEGIRSQPNSS